ncbi:alpha/beta hydrolase [Buchananella felis]|uniref:alpha/beta hydrolase n=1 Tax=Buchananella felis TaxID=3231492 RepID=UPI0035277123
MLGTVVDDELGVNWHATTFAVRPHRGVPGQNVAVLVHRPGTLGTRHGLDDAAAGTAPSTGAVFDAAAGDVGHPFPTECGRRAVLYVHGFQDYFFHPHLARAWEEAGFTFFALDLRGCGRAWDGAAEVGRVDDLRAYGDDLMRAVHMIRSAGAQQVVINAHSMGALLVTVWTHAFPEAVDALVLNSPWLDLSGGRAAKRLQRAAIRATAAVNRQAVLAVLHGTNSASLHYSTGGEFRFSLARKILSGAPARAGFLSSVVAAQDAVAAGLELPLPVLVCHSDQSELGLKIGSRKDTAEIDADLVLDVEAVAKRAMGLGPKVEVAVIPGGKHDLALSSPEVRANYFARITQWASAVLPKL